MKNLKITIIGGGAAGFFAAINYAEKNKNDEVVILEKTNKVLSKVKISGGGRCNVTNSCFEPAELIKFYPRGSKALLGPFTFFHPKDTVQWFEKRGVKLKREADNRIFPISDDSQTIVDCLIDSANNAGIIIKLNSGVKEIISLKEEDEKNWEIKLKDGEKIYSDKIIIASGSSSHIWEILKQLGHKIQPPVPSLFTFNINDPRLKNLAGVSFNQVNISVENKKLKADGALLITHWGLSGPAVLKLSAWGARTFNELNYKFNIIVNFVPELNEEAVLKELNLYKGKHPKKSASSSALFNLPLRFWEQIIEHLNLRNLKWNDLSKKEIHNLAMELIYARYSVNGKSTFKEEFVTCGGVSLKEVNFKTMESKIHKNLFFSGEVLDIDAITGGFNFQAAWTTAWIAANSILNN